METLLALYWRHVKLQPYGDVERREFAFQLPPGSFVRHRRFSTEEDARREAARLKAAAAFHSVAIYEYPDVEDMEGKKMSGVDLFFDLDVKGGNVRESLGSALEYGAALVDVLVEELGVSKSSIKVSYSGNRGVHIYTGDGHIRALTDKDARRLLAQYVTTSVLRAPRLPPTEPASDPCSLAPYGICRRILMLEAGLPAGVPPEYLDVQVIVDVHRLIRIPGSPNPKTGYTCTLLPSLDIDVDKVLDLAKPLKNAAVKVRVEKSVALPDGRTVEEGVKEVDLHDALFLVLHGHARLDKKR